MWETGVLWLVTQTIPQLAMHQWALLDMSLEMEELSFGVFVSTAGPHFPFGTYGKCVHQQPIYGITFTITCLRYSANCNWQSQLQRFTFPVWGHNCVSCWLRNPKIQLQWPTTFLGSTQPTMSPHGYLMGALFHWLLHMSTVLLLSTDSRWSPKKSHGQARSSQVHSWPCQHHPQCWMF